MEYKEVCLRDKIGEFLCQFAENDNRIYVIDSDLAKSTKTLIFKDKYPNRFIQAGIAEASAVSIADGLAAEGQIPFYVNFATFVTVTAWTQVRQSAYENSNSGMNYVRETKEIIQSEELYNLIHYNKLPKNVLDYLISNNYVSECTSYGWLMIDKKISQIYMRTLAEYAIKYFDKDIVLGTDSEVHSRDIYNYSICDKSSRTQCCKINLMNCFPQPSMNVGYEDILEFKHKRKDELYEFRRKIRELEEKMYKADSFEEIKHYETKFIEEWTHSLDNFTRILKEERIQFILGSITSLVAIPYVSRQISNIVSPNFSTCIQTGAGFLNIAIGYYNYRNKICAQKSDGGFSYIIKAKKEGIIEN